MIFADHHNVDLIDRGHYTEFDFQSVVVDSCKFDIDFDFQNVVDYIAVDFHIDVD